MALLRFGKVNTQLVIQRDYRNICYYETEVGPITLGVTGDGIACDLSEPAGGTAKFSYLLDADDPTALIGLPLIRTCRMLRAAGLVLP